MPSIYITFLFVNICGAAIGKKRQAFGLPRHGASRQMIG